MVKGFRPDKSFYIVIAGLAIGALIGVAFTALNEVGARIFSSIMGARDADVPRLGFTAPDFELLDLSGKPVRLSELKGSPVIINFWATWCNPCRIEMPLIQSAARDNPNLVILAVNADETLRLVQRFVEEFDLTFPVLMDPGAKVENMYRVEGLPTSFFLDKNGIIRSVQIGVLSEDKFAEHLEKIGVKK